ncbi:hypothetical protein JVU11DRAFT_8327 [Chiua virens]|nr:hypothetical protein JVU11DRAFT_8327 [Chiua virens]
MASSSLDRLVDDILIQILQVLSVTTVLSLRKVSSHSLFISKKRTNTNKDVRRRLDVTIFSVNSDASGTPGSVPRSLDATFLYLDRHVLSLCSPQQSSSSAHCEPSSLTKHGHACLLNSLISRHGHRTSGVRARVDQVMFIPGGTELLTVHGDTVVHWLIVSWPGLAHGLKQIGEWTPVEGVPCRVVKDGDVSGVIAVGPRVPSGSHGFAKVLSTSLKTPFMTLCDYARVPGVVVGIWQHLLFLDTRELEDGGLELLDWHAQTTGTAVLPRLPGLFGNFLDFVVFSGHILVVWEHCWNIDAVFMFQEAVSRPIGFTTCVAHRVESPCLDPSFSIDQGANWDIDWDRDGQGERCASPNFSVSPTLTIAARSRRRPESVSMTMLVPLFDEGVHMEKGSGADINTFPYRLTYLSPNMPARPAGNESGEDGVGVVRSRRELRLVSPGLLVLPPYDMQFGPVFETGNALYVVDPHRKRDLDRLYWSEDMNMNHGVDEASASGDKVDFDEGMGRFVVAKEHGGFEVVQLD